MGRVAHQASVDQSGTQVSGPDGDLELLRTEPPRPVPSAWGIPPPPLPLVISA